MDATYEDIRDALNATGKGFAAMSWDGVNVFGDHKSIERVTALAQTSDRADAIHKRIVETQQLLASTISEHETVTAALLLRVLWHQERVKALEAALRGSIVDMVGCLNAFEAELRETIGNTNYAVIREKVNHARAALAAGGSQ